MIRDPSSFDALLATVRRFVRERWHPIEAQVDAADDVPEDVVDELRRLGFFGWSIPPAYGGLGLTTEACDSSNAASTSSSVVRPRPP